MDDPTTKDGLDGRTGAGAAPPPPPPPPAEPEADDSGFERRGTPIEGVQPETEQDIPDAGR